MYNFGVESGSLFDYIQSIDAGNKVDGKPIYYWVNQHDAQVPGDAGFVGVVNSTNITVKDLILTKNREGVLFAYTEDSRIENVTASNNYYGIRLYELSNNTLADNTASNNTDIGILLTSSSDNTLTNNTANSNNWLGIFLASSSNDNTITNNTISNNNYGIRLYSSSNNLTTKNATNSQSRCIAIRFPVV